MTLKRNSDLDILKTYLQTKSKVTRWSHSKYIAWIETVQTQLSGSKVTNFQPLLVFTMGHIPAKLRQFLITSFWDFVGTDGQTDRRRQNQYLLACVQVTKTPVALFPFPLLCHWSDRPQNNEPILSVTGKNLKWVFLLEACHFTPLSLLISWIHYPVETYFWIHRIKNIR